MKLIKIVFLIAFIVINIFSIKIWFELEDKDMPSYKNVLWQDITKISYGDKVSKFKFIGLDGNSLNVEKNLESKKIVLLFFRPESWSQKEKIIQASTLSLNSEIKNNFEIIAVAPYLYKHDSYPHSIKVIEDKNLRLHKIFKPSERKGATIIVSQNYTIDFATDKLTSFQTLKSKLQSF